MNKKIKSNGANTVQIKTLHGVYSIDKQHFKLNDLGLKSYSNILSRFDSLYLSTSIYILAIDEVVEKKSGKSTVGIGRFFSSIAGRPIRSVCFHVVSLIDVKSRKSFIVTQEQQKSAINSSNKKKSQKSQKSKKKSKTTSQNDRNTKKHSKKRVGRPKGSKNKTGQKE